MKNSFYFLTLILFCACEQTQFDNNSDYLLVWQDNFDGAELDVNKWNYETGTGCQYGLVGWGNNELQYYKEDNISIIDGDFLQIQAREELVSSNDCGTFSVRNYTSGRINTKNKFDFTHGKVEAKIKLDADTAGVWHAFWMLPSYPAPNTYWPETGEIDIMEQYHTPIEWGSPRESELIGTVHFINRQMDGNEFIVKDMDFYNDFHVYSLEWDRVSLKWYVDNELYHVVNKTDNPDLEETWPFNEDFHLILNTAVGGNLGGNVNFDNPKHMLVDYVKVYKKINL